MPKGTKGIKWFPHNNKGCALFFKSLKAMSKLIYNNAFKSWWRVTIFSVYHRENQILHATHLILFVIRVHRIYYLFTLFYKLLGCFTACTDLLYASVFCLWELCPRSLIPSFHSFLYLSILLFLPVYLAEIKGTGYYCKFLWWVIGDCFGLRFLSLSLSFSSRHCPSFILSFCSVYENCQPSFRYARFTLKSFSFYIQCSWWIDIRSFSFISM